jgi:osmotically-inducible protein OsmY
MGKSAALLILPTGEPTGAEISAVQASAPLLVQSLEDLHLAERVACALRATGYGPLRSIHVIVHARLALLGGRVPSYYLKQLAQSTALTVSGIDQVRNDLEVA